MVHQPVAILRVSASSSTSIDCSLRVVLPGAAAERQRSVDGLCEAAQSLPCAALYPELTARLGEILARWKAKFAPHVWQRFVKVPQVRCCVAYLACLCTHDSVASFGLFWQTAAFGVARVLKEFNESTPVLTELLKHIHAAEKPVTVIDLCSGYGFLSMFLAELAPSDMIHEIVLVDDAWPNASANASGDLSNEHILQRGAWPVRLYTLKTNVKNSNDLRGLARHIIGDSDHPTLIAGIHLCGTLALRAVQLFNDCATLGATSLCLVPCCLPPPLSQKESRPRRGGGKRYWRRKYQVGGRSFDARTIETDPGGDDGGSAAARRFALFANACYECVDTPPGQKRCEAIRIHRTREGNHAQYTQDWHVFATRPQSRDRGRTREEWEAAITRVGGPVCEDGWASE